MLFVANWKMQLTHNESIKWLEDHFDDLQKLCEAESHNLIMCPSFTVLPWEKKPKAWGAQNCGIKEKGPYTGDVSVLTLKELGCSHVIVGHSERRRYYDETPEQTAHKVGLCKKNGLEPIICIGEMEDERNEGRTLDVLREQLEPILEVLREYDAKTLLLTYEPVWAIGTGKTPSPDELAEILNWLYVFIEDSIKIDTTILYGGSVNEYSAGDLITTSIDGFLLGKVSIDPEALKKIILSC